jgi:hypothetical protein
MSQIFFRRVLRVPLPTMEDGDDSDDDVGRVDRPRSLSLD